MPIQIPRNEYLRIKVIPKSPKSEVVEIMCHPREDRHPRENGDLSPEQTIKIRIKAVPEKGKANVELIRFLSRELNVPKENISILSGKTDHLKLIKIKYGSQ